MISHQPIQSNFQPLLIEVTGEGEIAIPPNAAVVNMGVMTEGTNLQMAQQQNSAAINKVIQTLLQLGIAHQHIQTFDYRINSQYDFEQGKQIFRGYKVTYLLQIKIEDLTLVGSIIDSAVNRGVNYVSDVKFIAGSKGEVYRKALTLSIHDALQKAKTIAGTLMLNVQPIPVQMIEGSKVEGGFPLHPNTYVKGISTTTFEPGRLTVKASITAFFYCYQ